MKIMSILPQSFVSSWKIVFVMTGARRRGVVACTTQITLGSSGPQRHLLSLYIAVFSHSLVFAVGWITCFFWLLFG